MSFLFEFLVARVYVILARQRIDAATPEWNGYCWPSLGLGNPGRAEILEGDVWGAVKIEHYVLGP